MIGGRVSHQARHAISKVRTTLGQAYAYSHKIANGLQRGIDIGKRVYSIAEPLLQAASPDMARTANKAVRQGLNSYEEIRSRVLDSHEAGQHVLSGIRKKVPELGL